MVKIIKKSLDEIATEKRNENLLKITKEMFKDNGFVNGGNNNGGCFVYNLRTFKRINHNPMIFTHFSNNFMEVYSPRYLDDALKLAEAYEEATGEEFTLKKDY